jgi:DNA-binding NarL/FixJ family response regulator
MCPVRLLLIDTNLEILNMAKKLLEPRYEVVGSFRDGAAALREVLAIDPDIILLDISLGDVNGLEIARRIRLLGCKAKAVFFSVHEHPDFVHAAISIGAAGYIFKNRAASDLVKGVEQVSAGFTFFPSRTDNAR